MSGIRLGKMGFCLPQLVVWLAFAPSLSAQPTPPPTVPPQAEPEKPVDLKTRIQLDPDRLDFSYVRDDSPVMSERENLHEFNAYNSILIHAHQFTTSQLMSHARQDVTFADLLKKTRRDFQFKLLAIEGRLKRLRALEPNKPLRDAGITTLYEGWIFPREAGVHMHDPMCILITELPPGLEPKLDYSPSKLVRFAGYSFKLMRYESQARDAINPDQAQFRRAPLLMGKSLFVDPEPDTDGGKPWRTTFLPGIVLLLGSIFAAFLVFNGFYRRTDKRYAQEQERRRNVNPFANDGEKPESKTES